MKRTDGFSLIEVLVTVAIVAGALTVLLGGLRRQIRSVRDLRSHTEARAILERAVNRFQYGDGAQEEMEIDGKYGSYRVTMAAVVDSTAGEADSTTVNLLADPRLLRRRVQVDWTDLERKKQLSLEAWRFLTEEPGS